MSTEPKAKAVHFDVDTALSATKHSRPLRKKSRIPSFSSPRAYAIVMPFDEMLARAKKENPDVQKLIDERGLWQEIAEVNIMIAELCDKACELWPNAFMVLVDHRSFPTSLQCIGLADNTHRINRTLPTADEIQQIRDRLDINGAEFKLGWYRDLYPDEHI
ncbi:hypothetical protein GGU10DRAFT_391290 [Lentinula aff. detonsa]|uniref:Uncharacterized protein n=1 Tax=Lentinula aff. detonsa TaxID=2804958 RepID=A0AA38L1Q6_9AGAR|nr:hypothetical protein GGU10DRAFT_391290 [Lentinula aff. detonsa]